MFPERSEELAHETSDPTSYPEELAKPHVASCLASVIPVSLMAHVAVVDSRRANRDSF